MRCIVERWQLRLSISGQGTIHRFQGANIFKQVNKLLVEERTLHLVTVEKVLPTLI